MSIFISHINEEASIAQVLKEWIEDTFLGQWDVFVSSDSDDIPAGKRWLEEIDKSLDSTDLIIIICSPQSIKRPWINFEAGCGWIKRVPIIPTCHSGLTSNKLPVPLSLFQGLDIEDEKFAEKLLKSLAKHRGFKKIPKIDYEKFKKCISDALKQITQVEYVKRGKAAATTAPKDSMEEIELKILKLFAANEGEYLTDETISNALKMHLTKVKYHINKMVSNKLIGDLFSMSGPTKYYLKQKGRAYLVEKSFI